jgi:Na+-driven multidrug efflux pump
MVLAFAFQGLGRATPPLIVMAVRVPIVLAVALWCVHAGLGEAGVFTTIAAGNVLASGVLGLLLVRELRRRHPAHAHGARAPHDVAHDGG